MTTTMIPDQRLLTITEVAAMFRVDQMTIKNWLKAGPFPEPIRGPGRRIYWTRDMVEEALNKPTAKARCRKT
jgi:predicted DNA-binding transcriptional regulator AlpA